MKLGEIYRYKSNNPTDAEFIDGLPNYLYATRSPNEGDKKVLLESGINRIASITDPLGIHRIPAVLISSSPHKVGSVTTPWQDIFNPDMGIIRYYGDQKIERKKAHESRGNELLLDLYAEYSSGDIEARRNAVPLIFFKRISVEGRPKGNVQFMGFGIIEGMQIVTQYHPQQHYYFSNYVFNFAVFDLSGEGEEFDWNWINARRNKNLKMKETELLAPKSWKKWIKGGNDVLGRCRRRVSKLSVVKKNEQIPDPDSDEYRVLQLIYNFYSPTPKKKRFEALATNVARNVINSGEGVKYYDGWITPGPSDGGIDFVGRLDVGSGFSTVKLVVVGQAKCEQLDDPTNGINLARTVARMKRGWIGVYVTTSYFSEAVQMEVIEDEYPIILINGIRLATEVKQMAYLNGFKDINSYLELIDSEYESRIKNKRPEEVLFL